jgi:predicted RNase H-like nuclease (RuvC/YqgF family)
MVFGNKFLVTTNDFLDAMSEHEFSDIFHKDTNEVRLHEFIYNFKNQIEKERNDELLKLNEENDSLSSKLDSAEDTILDLENAIKTIKNTMNNLNII